jgi:1-phosphofructokinase
VEAPASALVPVAVFTVAPIVVVTIETADGGTTVTHVNVGGQGAWVARAIATLGGAPTLCAPFGGDTGRTAQLLLEDAGYQVAAVETRSDCGLYVERRDESGRRTCMFETPAHALGPRDMDDLHEAAVRHGIESGTCVVTGSPFEHHLDPAAVRRLCLDLHSAGVVTVADLSGAHLAAALDAGIDLVKVADDELVRDGLVASLDDVAGWLDDVVGCGAVRTAAVASSSTGSTVARTPDRRIVAEAPHFEVVDPRGSGDAMCAALALATGNRVPIDRAVRLGLAAGAANATRRSTAAPGIDAVMTLESIIEMDVEPVA